MLKTTELGRSGLKVSRLCFGTLTMSPLQRNLPPEEGARLLVHAYEMGVRFLDTADLYGTYPHIKLALKDYYDKNGVAYDHAQFPDCAHCAHGCELH